MKKKIIIVSLIILFSLLLIITIIRIIIKIKSPKVEIINNYTVLSYNNNYYYSYDDLYLRLSSDKLKEINKVFTPFSFPYIFIRFSAERKDPKFIVARNKFIWLRSDIDFFELNFEITTIHKSNKGTNNFKYSNLSENDSNINYDKFCLQQIIDQKIEITEITRDQKICILRFDINDSIIGDYEIGGSFDIYLNNDLVIIEVNNIDKIEYYQLNDEFVIYLFNELNSK